jgi:hypothetical protein
MLGVMYRITKDANGVILVCLDCQHTERVNEFDDGLGSPRTQAARAMLKHSRNEHGKELIGKHKPQKMERRY